MTRDVSPDDAITPAPVYCGRCRRRLILGIFVFLASHVYIAFYLHARVNHWYVHHSGFSSDAAGVPRVANHRIQIVEFGGLDPRIKTGWYIFLPARYAELAYWHIAEPVGVAEW